MKKPSITKSLCIEMENWCAEGEKLFGKRSWIFTKIIVQGDPNQNSPFLRAMTQKLSISDHKLLKPKCVWEAVFFFQYSKVFYIFQLFVYNFSKKTTASQKHFGFTNLGSEMLIFWVIALRKGEFWFGSPCTYLWK